MGKTIFRMLNGRVVPMVVDEEVVGEGSSFVYIQTPKHIATERKLTNKSAFTIPNAICQKCGKDVFYYENSSGSKVLFDSLGPPWPIHPCYSAFIEKKKNILSAKELGWEPVIIKKAVITSSGALKMQGTLNGEEVRFSFDEKTFSRMRISIKDAENLIIFGSVDKGKVQTHNGKKSFSTRFNEVKNSRQVENKIIIDDPVNIFGIKNTIDNNYYLIDVIEKGELTAQILINKNKYDKYFVSNTSLIIKKTSENIPFAFKCKSESHGMYLNLNVLSDGITYVSSYYRKISRDNNSPDKMHFVGFLNIDKMQLFSGGDDQAKNLLISGFLNKSFHTNYSITNSSLSLSIYESYKKNRPHNMSAMVFENQNTIEMKINCADIITISTKAIAVGDSYASKLTRMKAEAAKAILKKKTKQENKKQHHELTVDIEDQITNLSSRLSTAMADAFASAKKRK